MVSSTVSISNGGVEENFTPAKRPCEAAGSLGFSGEIEVQNFLTRIGLSRYFPRLIARGFDCMEALDVMEEEDMRQEAGMLPGHVRILQRHLSIRRKKQHGAALEPASEPREGQGGGLKADAEIASQDITTEQGSEEDLPTGQDGSVSIDPSHHRDTIAVPPRSKISQQQTQHDEVIAAQSVLAPAQDECHDQWSKTWDNCIGNELPIPLPDLQKDHKQVEEVAALGAIQVQESLPFELPHSNLAEERYSTMPEVGQPAEAGDVHAPSSDNTLLALAQLAEESAQLVVAAVTFCSWPQVDPSLVTAALETAQHSAQQASWAAVAAMTYGDSEQEDKEQTQKWQHAAMQAASVAEQYLRECTGALGVVQPGGVRRRIW